MSGHHRRGQADQRLDRPEADGHVDNARPDPPLEVGRQREEPYRDAKRQPLRENVSYRNHETLSLPGIVTNLD